MVIKNCLSLKRHDVCLFNRFWRQKIKIRLMNDEQLPTFEDLQPVEPLPDADLLLVRTQILASHNFPAFHDKFDEIRNDLSDYYNLFISFENNPGLLYNQVPRILDTREELFASLQSIDPNNSLVELFLEMEDKTYDYDLIPFKNSDYLQTTEKDHILHLLWIYGEDYEDIVDHLYSFQDENDKGKAIERLKNLLLYAPFYQCKKKTYLKKQTVNMAHLDFTHHFLYILLPSEVQNNFGNALLLMIKAINVNPIYCAKFAEILKDYEEYFSFSIFNYIVQNCDCYYVDFFIQFCLVYKLFDYSDLGQKYNSFPFQIKRDRTYMKQKLRKQREAKQSKALAVTTPQEPPVEISEDVIHTVINELQSNNSILYDLIFRDHIEVNSKALMAFSENILLSSQRTFDFIYRLIPQLYSRSSLYELLTPKKQELYQSLVFTQIEDLPAHLCNIMHQMFQDLNSDPDEVIYCTIAGDAAAVYQIVNKTKVPKNLYCFLLLPLNYHYHTFPVQYQILRPGSANDLTMAIFDTIIDIFPKESQNKIKIVFKAVDGDPKMGQWFTNALDEVLTTQNINPSTYKQYLELVDTCLEYALHNEPWPISDLLHLFKCARAHIIGHLICVDPYNFICINMDLLIEASQLFTNMRDRSQQARMSDQYALEVFSYQTLLSLIVNARFESAFYVLPFVCMNEATRNKSLYRSERLQLLYISYRVFMFHLKNVTLFGASDMFPTKFHKGAIGTLFGEPIFIKRCICTSLGLSIALRLDIPFVALSRVGTHDVEGHFGLMRILQHDVNTAERGINVAISTAIFQENLQILNMNPKINTRENNSGVKIKKQVEDDIRVFHDIDLANILYNLMIRGFDENMPYLIEHLNNYSQIYATNPSTLIKNTRNGSVKPYARYLEFSSYKLTTLPIPQDNTNTNCMKSPLNYYFSNNKKRLTSIASLLQYQQWYYSMKVFMEQMTQHREHAIISEEIKNKINETKGLLEELISPITLKAYHEERHSIEHPTPNQHNDEQLESDNDNDSHNDSDDPTIDGYDLGIEYQTISNSINRIRSNGIRQKLTASLQKTEFFNCEEFIHNLNQYNDAYFDKAIHFIETNDEDLAQKASYFVNYQLAPNTLELKKTDIQESDDDSIYPFDLLNDESINKLVEV